MTTDAAAVARGGWRCIEKGGRGEGEGVRGVVLNA